MLASLLLGCQHHQGSESRYAVHSSSIIFVSCISLYHVAILHLSLYIIYNIEIRNHSNEKCLCNFSPLLCHIYAILLNNLSRDSIVVCLFL